ncbi:MAG TPA: transporter substrate-binding domain-containing protein [Roseateles sp.]|nr:transporter substrate-binding domain-containing protein [Roseateles sp.]
MRALLLAMTLLLPALPALACGPYRVGFYSFGPFYYRDAAGNPAGVDADLIAALAERSGCTLQGSLESRVRTWALMNSGKLDITVSGIATPERERLAEFWPYARTRNHALLPRSLAQRVNSAEAFVADRSLRVGVVRGFRHGERLDAWLERLRNRGRVYEVADFDALLRVLRAGRVELVLVHPMNLRPADADWLEEFSLQDWAPQDEVQAALVVSHQQVKAADRARLHRALQALLQEGEVDRILRRHLGEEMARQVRLPR